MTKKDQDFLVQKIRTQYTEKEYTAVDELKDLDEKVKFPAKVFAYVFGSVSAIVMGSGMSLVMTDIAKILSIANPMLCGIIIGVIGMIMAIINYPIYDAILSTRRKKYADEIIALSEKIMKE
ncbi:MAG: dihydropteridine reductase [Clostridia bacterium]|nr:dihydropteridine reductase [Clostridia bacterium]